MRTTKVKWIRGPKNLTDEQMRDKLIELVRRTGTPTEVRQVEEDYSEVPLRRAFRRALRAHLGTEHYGFLKITLSEYGVFEPLEEDFAELDALCASLKFLAVPEDLPLWAGGIRQVGNRRGVTLHAGEVSATVTWPEPPAATAARIAEALEKHKDDLDLVLPRRQRSDREDLLPGRTEATVREWVTAAAQAGKDLSLHYELTEIRHREHQAKTELARSVRLAALAPVAQQLLDEARQRVGAEVCWARLEILGHTKHVGLYRQVGELHFIELPKEGRVLEFHDRALFSRERYPDAKGAEVLLGLRWRFDGEVESVDGLF